MNYQNKKTLPNSASWLFNPPTQPTTNPSSSRMYVLKKNSDTINLEQNLYRDDDDEFEWKYNDSYDYLKNEEVKPYDKITLISNKVRIFKFLNANVKGDIEYSHTNFIVRSTIGIIGAGAVQTSKRYYEVVIRL